ncbi:PE-PGRS family protein [Streptomyces sp. NPDC032472]|uniref:PE-PGRS family protein n=1 Tax=Streptomyces sp. NPDC032472 TaxID=3155018 RepID=UPI0033EF83B2
MGREHGADQADDRSADRCWERVGCGPQTPVELRYAWRTGVSRNRAAPVGLLVRLLDRFPDLLWRHDLPAAVLDAAVDHPDRQVRGALGERWTARRRLSPEQWSRLVLGERSGARRGLLLEAAVGDGVVFSDPVHEAFAADPSAQVRAEAARLAALPKRLRTALAGDAAACVRAAVCEAAWAELDGRTRALLIADPDPQVRQAVAVARHEEVPLTAEVFDAAGGTVRLAEERRLERGLAERIVRQGEPHMRSFLARNPSLDADLVAALAADPEEYVRLQVSLRPELTDEQRFAVPVEIDPRNVRRPVAWVVALHDDPEAMRRLAASQHLLVRSSVAMARRLPPDVVERLARDEDRVVQLFLAERCEDAPADMLLDVWLWWSGSLSVPDRPYGHPNFPRRDLLRFADDPHPRLRQLAADDPDSTPELVERFSMDAHEEVRLRAATDPRLSADSAVRLLGDPHPRVRAMAARHPRLPGPVLAGLLADLETAEYAAKNPSLPVAVMDRLIG